MQNFYYLLIDFFCFLFPFLLSFDKRVAFYTKWKRFLISSSLTAIVFLVWDYFFTRIGVWGFNHKYLSGIYVTNLPIEEVMFFFAIPYACVFAYEVFKAYTGNILYKSTPRLSFISFSFCTIIAVWLHEYKYSFWTFTLLAFLFLFNFLKNKSYILNFMLSYLIILIPFFLVNGILTGTGLEEAIVWYDDTENMGIRLLTIPIEDVFYGMALVLLNIMIYEEMS